MSCFGAVT